MPPADFRHAICQFIQEQAQPPDKFSHQPRLYALARSLGTDQSYDDDVLFAAAWLHDLGVFVGHRPASIAELAKWDHVAYAIREVPALLKRFAFPSEKIPAVLEAIRTHLPTREPTTIEGVLLRDADILEQLGAIGALRAVSKVGRDTRYPTHAEAVQFLTRSLQDLPSRIKLPRARALAEERVAVLKAFLAAVERETVA
jgi:uncharacterized protein